MSAKPKVATPDGAPSKGGGKKKLLLIVLPVLLLLGGGAAGWFSGLIPKLLGKGEAAHGTEHGAEHAEASGGHGAPAAAGHGAAGGEKKDAHGKAEPAPEARAAGAPLFMDLPDIVANLNTGPRRAAFVKLKAKLELSRSEDQGAIQAAMPRVLDLFQGYLREMRPEELRGTAGTYRLREELMARTNLAAPPARVVAVLFTEMIIQ